MMAAIQRVLALVTTYFVAGAVGLPLLSASAAEIGIDNAVPGGGVIRKQIVSLREARFLDLERQRFDFSCGAATVATILKYAYRRDADEHSVLQEMLKVSDQEKVVKEGFSLLDIKSYVESIGLQALGFKLPPENLERLKVPAIVLLDIKGYKHFVVFKKRRGDRFYIGDPALGNRVMSLDEFVASWNGIVFTIVGNSFDPGTVLLRPREPLSAKRLLADPVPVVNAPLLEFGFGHADLF